MTESEGSASLDRTLADLSNAVNSIPAYVESSEVMLALNPWADHHDTGELCDHRTWRQRGW